MEDINNCTNSLPEDIFLCGQCKITFNSLTTFLDHKKTPCNIETPAISNVAKEYENYFTPEKTKASTILLDKKHKVFCKKCLKPFTKLKSLELHLKTHVGEKPYQCPLCGRCFIQNSHLQRHIHSHKVWPDGLSNTIPKTSTVDLLSYACSYCNSILSNYSQFRLHLKNHIDLKKFKCVQSDCISLFDNIELLLSHMSNDHSQLQYICHLCSGIFTSLEDIALHQQGHKETTSKSENKYKCLHCDAIFNKKDTLLLHMSTNDHNKMCIHCNKVFVSDKRLRLHLQTHGSKKCFYCNTCGLSFKMKKYLTSHMLKHGESQFTCSICNHKFKRQDILSRHIKSHQNTKKLQCPFRDKLNCKMEFTRTDKLKLHINYHTKRMAVITKKKKCNNNPVSTLEILIIPMNNKDSENIVQNVK